MRVEDLVVLEVCAAANNKRRNRKCRIFYTESESKSSPQNDVYKALTTLDGLSGWWTTNTQGESKVGGVIQFRFGAGGFDMKVLELHPAKSVLWQVVDGPKEWIGTKVSWELKQEGDYTVILFKHQDWKEPVEFMHHCSTKWGSF